MSFRNFFCHKKDINIASDKNQEDYRTFFGIKDKYLIQQEIDTIEGQKRGFIVFIDEENDVDWVDSREGEFWSTKEEKEERDKWIANLNLLHNEPCNNINKKDIIAFKKMVGAAYVLALQKQFTEINTVINESKNFIQQRNKEASRVLCLKYSSIITILFLAFWIFNITVLESHKEWVSGIVMGILGSYVSIWTRFGKIEMTGLSSKVLHFLECFSRLFIGGIFALVGICAVKSGLILSLSNIETSIYSYALVGFISGFSERFIPSMIENFIKKDK